MLNNLMVRDLRQQSVNKSKIEIIELIEDHIKEMKKDASSYNKEVEDLERDLILFKNLVYNIDTSQELANPNCNIVYIPKCYDNSCEFECTYNAQNESTCTFKIVDCTDDSCTYCGDGTDDSCTYCGDGTDDSCTYCGDGTDE